MDARPHRHLNPSLAPPGPAEMDSWIVHGDLPEFLALRRWVFADPTVRADLQVLVDRRLAQAVDDGEMEGISSYKLWSAILRPRSAPVPPSPPSPVNQPSRLFASGEAWDRLLTSISHRQAISPDVIPARGRTATVGATLDLRSRVDLVLSDLEATQGWHTNRVRHPVMILGDLDGVETGVRLLIRQRPLEYVERNIAGHLVRLPTLGETLRIKGVLIIKRNTVRDFADFAALSAFLGPGSLVSTLADFDTLYQNSANASPLYQLCRQLSNPQPSDLKQTNLHLYKDLAAPWREWESVRAQCVTCAVSIATLGLQPASPASPAVLPSGPASAPIKPV